MSSVTNYPALEDSCNIVKINCNAINTAITMCKLLHFNAYKPQKCK